MQQEQAIEGHRLSPQQRRSWQLLQESQAYGAQCAVLIQGRLDREALQRALGVIVNRHEILRTTFLRQPGRRFPLQIIAASGSLSWHEVKRDEFDYAEQQFEELYANEKHRAFDLQKGPLLRATLITQSDDRHVLLLNMPALCADAWTLKNLVDEIGRVYAANLQRGFDGPFAEADEVTQYLQFSEWQHELLENDDQPARQHWRAINLESVVTFTLPSETVVPIQSAFDFESYAFTFNADVAAKVYEVAAEQGISVGSILLACWSTLLWRLTRQSEIIIGASVDGRKYPELHEAFGLLAKVVPIKLHLEDAPFHKVLKQIDECWRDAYTFQEHFTWEGEAAVVKHPFIAVNYAYEERAETFSAGGVSFSLLRQDTCAERFKIRLTCARTGNELAAEIHYDPRHLLPAEAERLASQFHTLLNAALANPAASTGDLDILSSEERRQLLFELNNTRAEFHDDACLHGLFEKQVERSPEATAVVFQQQRKSYQVLNAEANRLAHYLRKKGVGPEVRVGLCVERSAEMLVGLLGILKAGGAYVPLDAEHPPARLSHQLDEVEAPVLITQQKFLKSLPPFKGTIICLDSDRVDFAGESESNPMLNTVAHNLAYVIYTSGSTGTPKGVSVSHRNLVNYTEFICRELQLEVTADAERWTFATVSTLSADLGNTCVFPSLLSGGCLHILSYEVATNAALFARYVTENPIDVLKIVPSHLRQLLLASHEPQLLPRRYLITGGESLSLELAQQIIALAGDCRLLNHYGPTETTVGSLVNREVSTAIAAGEYHSLSESAMLNIPIGRPVANTTVYILDQRYRPVPQGVAGEIYIGGQGVARGYLRQGGLTAERFLPDPFGLDAGARLYRTGDRGRFLLDGTVEFLGRVDEQVKIRGYRIELGEIEATLLLHEAVSQAIVTVRQGEAENRQLVAYVVTELEAEQSASQLMAYLRERLPDYMVPAAIVPVTEIPLTPNGKVDRQALSVMQSNGRPSSERRRRTPSTETEKRLAEIWREVLRVEKVGVDDNFFALGGDSILSIQIIARANQSGLQLTPRQLFDHPTVAQLATLVGTAESSVHAEQGVVSGTVPLTPIQQWFFEQQPINPHHWNMALMLEIRDGAYDSTLLSHVFEQLLLHHDALRLRFSHTEHGWRQFNAAEEIHAIFQEVDLSGLPELDHASAIEARASEVQASLELEHGPLLRAVYFHLGGHRGGRLLIVINHLAVDGVSWRILLEDLMLGCEQARAGKPISFPPKTTSFREWADQLQDYAQSNEVRQQSAYWMETAARSRQLRPPSVDHEGASNKVSAARTLSVRLDAEETQALLQEVPEVYHTQINEVLLTALVLTFAGWTKEWRVLVDVEGHGREEIGPGVDVTRTVGWFTTHYPMVFEVSEESNVGEALKAVKVQVRAVPQRGIGYGLLRYLSEDQAVREALSSGPEPSVSFNYLGQFDQTLESSAALTWAVESSGPTHDPEGNRSHLLDINGGILGGQLFVNWTYNENIHRRETIERVAEDFAAVLRKIIAHCQSPEAGAYTLSDFPDAKLTQQELDVIAAKIGSANDGQTDTRIANLEDLYPLSPLQEGMLFQGLYAPAAAGIYIRQLSSALYGEVNITALEQSWQRVIDRHPILRTSFSWNELDKVLQLVHRRVGFPLERQDWRGLSAEEQEKRLDAFLKEDRERGFDLSVPPLMRLHLIQTGPDSFQFIWTYHHLLLDGWSRSLVYKEVLTLYDALSRGEDIQLERPRPYRDYIRWLEQQDLAKAEYFWRETLRGFHVATSLGDERLPVESDGREEGFGQQQINVSEEATAALQNVTRKQQLTLNTLVQGAWALLLSRYSGEEDIVFGITISGRPAALPHVEAIVGPFINTLPLRVQITPGDALQAWLRRLQSQVIELYEYDYSPLMQVQRWSEIPRGQQLFESTFVLANYPMDLPARGETGNLDFGRMKFLAAQPYSLAVAAMPGDTLLLAVGYDRVRFNSLLISRMLEDWRDLLKAIIERVSDPEQRLLDIPHGASQTPDSATHARPHQQSHDDMETQFMF